MPGKLSSLKRAVVTAAGWAVAAVYALVVVARAFVRTAAPMSAPAGAVTPARPAPPPPPTQAGVTPAEAAREYGPPMSPSRREFLTAAAVALGGAGAVIVAIPWVGFLVKPFLKQPPNIWRAVGPVANFPLGAVTLVSYEDTSPQPWAGLTAQSGAYIRRVSDQQFVAFSIHCTHLGCPVRWIASAELFFCPCHGGVFYQDGSVAAPPPPRPLVQFPVRVRNGQVEIQTQPLPITGFSAQG